MKLPETTLAQRVANKMLEKDTFLQWLNPAFIKIEPGYCLMKLLVRDEFLNHVSIVHGGITYSIADAAFAYASNAHNQVAVALNTSMSYPNAAFAGDELTVEATEDALGGKTATYRVTVKNQRNQLVGIFNGTVYRKKEKYFEE